MNTTSVSLLDYYVLAGPVGKVVLLLLLAASIWCWVLIIEGAVSVLRLKVGLGRWRRAKPASLFAALLQSASQAAGLQIPRESPGETRLRITEAMNRHGRTILARTEGGLVNLAVIASVAPFIGLFGTVWGIMTSFTAIAAAKDTSLAVVAPGIAEALATTAFGLAAAIPASIGYTRLGAAIGAAAQEMASLIELKAVSEIELTAVAETASHAALPHPARLREHA